MKLKTLERYVRACSWVYFILIGLALGYLWGTPSQSDLEAEYERGLRVGIDAVLLNHGLAELLGTIDTFPLNPTDTIRGSIIMRNGESRSGRNFFFEFIDSTDTMPAIEYDTDLEFNFEGNRVYHEPDTLDEVVED